MGQHWYKWKNVKGKWKTQGMKKLQNSIKRKKKKEKESEEIEEERKIKPIMKQESHRCSFQTRMEKKSFPNWGKWPSNSDKISYEDKSF